MKTVTVSPKYQVVIPREVRGILKVKPGQKMRVIAYDRHVVFVPVRSITKARGSLKGIDTDVRREKEDRAL
ncbi:MAG: AbrB/MazE/SpoVT family DNA-binding domain-containing protein [Anaerolineaceae bacterium]|jgi:AbrB family looped-hinge helix DNA binding protein|nr:AbrB/MazE/SpoVT family DNA-binding domain-containing protein [Anaerolineaceae bacterium]